MSPNKEGLFFSNWAYCNIQNIFQNSQLKLSGCGGSFRIMYCYYYDMFLAKHGASEAVNLCSRSTKYSEQKCASYFGE
jgi:hypothetical protein